MMTFELSARRIDATGSSVSSKETTFVIDTSMTGRPDALNPVELLLAALSACFIKGIERVAGTLGIEYDSVDVALTAHRPLDEARGKWTRLLALSHGNLHLPLLGCQHCGSGAHRSFDVD
jgi:uncharacterized OsmC-like protein